jgi:hypothetical protein
MLLASAGPLSAFILSSPSLEQSVVKAPIEQCGGIAGVGGIRTDGVGIAGAGIAREGIVLSMETTARSRGEGGTASRER